MSTATSSATGFEFTRRGYEPEQVDQHLRRLTAERDSALTRIRTLQQRVDELLARAAADFEAKLARRREQAESDLVTRKTKAEARLTQIESRADQLRTDAEKLRTEADRSARRTTQNAEQQARDILSEAQAKADRISSESARELAALENRRDSINAQLANVRSMLATLTGAGVSTSAS